MKFWYGGAVNAVWRLDLLKVDIYGVEIMRHVMVAVGLVAVLLGSYEEPTVNGCLGRTMSCCHCWLDV